MSGNAVAFVAALAVAALAFAPDAFPGLLFYHTWQYALALVLGLTVTVVYTFRERRYRLATAGVMVVGLAALYSGLTGADTATLARGAGQVVHAGGGAVVRFPIADAQTVRSGTATLDVIGRGPLRPSGRAYVDSSVLVAEMRPAAYVDAADARGRHLTVTQPQGNTFLSPVLLFPGRATLRGKTYPIDLFALPGVERQVQAFYFSPQDVAAVQRADLTAGQPALLVAITDDHHTLIRGGIAFLPQGVPTAVGDLRLTASIGRYPVLMVASAPWPPLLIGGALLAVLGVFVRRRKEAASIAANGTA
ncbi:MAG TPA: hypothetical protein VNJ51_01030 [Candidatus Dormibacteraeota bacterium]|nr:hypothetical protein [Candidatus Dormibacteraeota bacterium]